MGAALERIAEYFPLIDDLVSLESIAEGDTVRYRMSAPSLPGPMPRPAEEYTLAAVYLRTRLGLGVPFPLRRVDFDFPPPENAGEHVRIFGCDVLFDRPRAELVISRGTYDQTAPKADPTLYSVLNQHAQLLLERLPKQERIVGQVRHIILASLGNGEPTVAQAARQLAMGEKTLQRRLTEAGTSFGTIVDEERQRSAKTLLTEPGLSLAEIAFLLGFSDQSAFTRAFARWTGMPPGKWRGSTAVTEARR